MRRRLARFKKENKELLSYLLFEAHDERAFIAGVKTYIDTEIDAIPREHSLDRLRTSPAWRTLLAQCLSIYASQASGPQR
jgi:hypothetical protein